MVPRALDKIRRDDIEALVSAHAPERRALDYKGELPGGSDAAKKEFLADVVSFANTDGGDILYGVTERRDEQGRGTGEPEAAVGLIDANANSIKLRLDSMVRTGMAPVLPNVEI